MRSEEPQRVTDPRLALARHRRQVMHAHLAALQERVAEVNKRVARLVKRGYTDAKSVVIEVSELYAEPQKCISCAGTGKVCGYTCERCYGLI